MMKTYNIRITNILINRKAITFVEIMICLVIASMVFGVIYGFMSYTSKNYMFGVVNLQNLQDARLAINYLRRDFAAACPRFDDPEKDKKNGYINLQKIRKQLFLTNGSIKGGDLIQVSPNKLSFHKFVYGSSDKNPRVEPITYQFDKSSQTLTRISRTKGTKVFSGIEDVNFALYFHKINPDIPLLWVKLRIHEANKMYGNKEIGKALELTTTISSAFINSSQKTKYWRYATGHSN